MHKKAKYYYHDRIIQRRFKNKKNREYKLFVKSLEQKIKLILTKFVYQMITPEVLQNINNTIMSNIFSNEWFYILNRLPPKITSKLKTYNLNNKPVITIQIYQYKFYENTYKLILDKDFVIDF